MAVLGGGIGGSATAFFLSELFEDTDENVSIDLWERTDRIGGRVYSVPFAGSKYEAGASILHSSNRYADSLSRRFGLHRQDKDADSASDLMGIFDGEDIVFEESAWSLVTLARLAHRYGLDLLRMQSLISSMLHQFANVYSYQKMGVAFQDVGQMLSAMSHKFPDLMRHSFRDQLFNMSLSNRTIDELVQGISMVNYGQPVSQLHAFVGAVSSAGADLSGSLWNIAGGNEQLAQQLAARSAARLLLQREAQQLQLLPNGSFSVKDGDGREESYDVVVIAHPLRRSQLTFRGFSRFDAQVIADAQAQGAVTDMHRTVASFVSGKRSANFASHRLNSLIVCRDKYFFQSIAKLRAVANTRANASEVFKIFSPQPLTSDQLALLFDHVQDIHVIPWLAYPEYRLLQADFPRFQLRPGLWYVNAIESAASAMEMSLISAKNAAIAAHAFLLRSHGTRHV